MFDPMALATNLGFPRIGPKRELKKALESYWAGTINEQSLLQTAGEIRQQNWKFQKDAGLDHIPSGDFSLYDHTLDTCCMVGAIPPRFGWKGGPVDGATYFTMARGIQTAAMEMTKWFDTNYHYIVPEFEPQQTFCLASTKVIDEFCEAKSLGIQTRPVIVGPVSFLLLGKSKDPTTSTLSLLDRLLPVYKEVIARLEKAGAENLQIDEPCLVYDTHLEVQSAYQRAYSELKAAAKTTKMIVTTYFDDLGDNLTTAMNLPVEALHLDLVRAPTQLDRVLDRVPPSLSLSLGVVDGRNIWKTDFERALALIEKAVDRLGSDRVLVGPSCSLLHSPVDLAYETRMDDELKNWLAFAKQKIEEISMLVAAVNRGRASIAAALTANTKAMESRSNSPRIHNPSVKKRTSSVSPHMLRRQHPYAERTVVQRNKLKLPAFPTTTIGSFPQTTAVRHARAELKKGTKTQAEYTAFLKQETEKAIRFQEHVGLDVLVHGEFERNDMVEYFGEQLEGFTFTQNGWVQSYGSRYVKPPVIFGDVTRPHAMTVEWSRFAQSLTKRPVKGMLTGPVTILQWSFVRDDQPRAETCRQIALAIRDEVVDLETAGLSVIQIDEPAIREGLPLKRSRWDTYLTWAVDAFRLASSGVRDETQIHTHMCYSEFNDIIEAIGQMDADVISIETSRSQMELLDAFERYRYPNEIGPGVYDIHSPRIPTEKEMVTLLKKALTSLSSEQVWVNPDCGLKTRRWEEVEPSLKAMVGAAKELRTSR